MRISSYAVARPAFYDRNATSTLLNYGNALAPHAPTTRWTTTVAAGKKANVETSMVMYFRVTAATAASEYSCDQLITSGATSARPLYAVTNSNTTYNQYAQFLGTYTLFAGEVLEFRTYDASTGGTVYFQGSAKLTIFDA